MKQNNQNNIKIIASRKRFPVKKLIIIVLAVIILFCVGAAITWWVISKNSSTSKEATGIYDEQTSQDLSEAQTLANNGKTNEAKAAYDKIIAKTEDSFKKSLLLIDKSNVFFNDGDYNSALTIAEQAEGVNKNNIVESDIALIYETKGDKVKAIEYYNKAIKLVDKSQNLADDTIKHYQNRINELSGASDGN